MNTSNRDLDESTRVAFERRKLAAWNGQSEATMSEQCKHKTGTVILNRPEVQITQCDWGCGSLLVSTAMVDYEVDQPTVTQLQTELATLRAENVRLARENELLRAVASEAHEVLEQCTFPELDGRAMLYMEKRQAAIDGGALEATE